MFTIDQINAVLSKVKSGADFPKSIQALISLGVTSYDTFVADGHSVYFDGLGASVASGAKYSPLDVEPEGDKSAFSMYLKLHQHGGSDYPSFCRHAAASGVEKWHVDTVGLTCTYYSKAGDEMLAEAIPGI